MEALGPNVVLGFAEVPFPRAAAGASLNFHVTFLLVSFGGVVVDLPF